MKKALLASIVTAVIALQGETGLAQKSPAAHGFQENWDRGLDAFNLGKYEDAWIAFERARDADPSKPGPYRYLGRTARALKRWSECVANSTQALRLNPTSQFSADVRKDVEICRKAFGRPPFPGKLAEDQGAISVNASVEGASVEVDGLKKGATPLLPFPVNPGKHRIHLERQGYHAVDVEVDVVPSIVLDVDAAMEVDQSVAKKDDSAGSAETKVNHGWLVFTTDASSTILFDGAPVTLAEGGTLQAAPGIHILEVQEDGHEPWRRRVTVVRGQKRAVTVTLKRTEDRLRERRSGFIALGVAAAAGTTGVVFGMLSNARLEQAEDILRVERKRPSGAELSPDLPEATVHTREELSDLGAEGKRYGMISNIAYGVGAIALGASIYYFVLERSAERKGYELPMAVVPIVGPDGEVGAQVVYSGGIGF
ncbi:MAG: PEGA domain-containing protein [Deltaproteobacteria bacterium]|nr:PEGA domain-containing protein [Deltaproteobacteria bacterium]